MSKPGSYLNALDKNNVRVCLSAGGVKGPVHCGVLKRLELEQLDIKEVAGASVGAIVAALYTNGKTPEEITAIFVESLARRDSVETIRDLLPDAIDYLMGGWAEPGRYDGLYDFSSVPNVLRALGAFDPLSLLIGGTLDLRKSMRLLCERYQLKPNNRLTIYAHDLLRHRLVKLSGTNYDLSEGLALACALPGIYRPIWHWDGRQLQLLGDAAQFHYSPAEDFEDTAIFSVFEPATEMPSGGTPFDLFLAACEVWNSPLARGSRFVDPHKHLVVTTRPKWPGLYMNVRCEDILEMERLGFEETDKAIAHWRAGGRI